jgi:hypothetical protein
MARGGDPSNLRHQNAADKIEDAGREAKVVAAVLRGMNYPQAAEYAGYADRASAYNAVQRVLKRMAADLAPNAEALRALELARLDRILLELSTIALSRGTPPDLKLKYLEAMHRNIDQRSKLLNLYAPTQVEVFTHDALNYQISQLADRLGLPVPEHLIEPSFGLGPAPEAADPAGSPEDREGA